MFIRQIFSTSRITMNNLSSVLHGNIPSRLFISSTSKQNSSIPTDSSNPLVTVWWDSSCPLCLREINLMKKWTTSGTIDFVDIASSTSTCPIDRRIMLARFHAQERGGKIVDGAQAFALLWKHIPRMQRLGLFLTKNPKALNVFERFYSNLFLPYLRPTFQKILKWLRLGGGKYK